MKTDDYQADFTAEVAAQYAAAGEPYGPGMDAAWRWFDERVEEERKTRRPSFPPFEP